MYSTGHLLFSFVGDTDNHVDSNNHLRWFGSCSFHNWPETSHLSFEITKMKITIFWENTLSDAHVFAISPNKSCVYLTN